MPVDMKRTIADAAITLLMEKKVKKLTVKDIVQECHITRQTFYYHFEDIPHLLQWILEQGMERIKAEALSYEEPEQKMRYLFLVALNLKPYIEKTMQSGYAEELKILLDQKINRTFEEMIDREHLYPTLSRDEQRLILRYHTQAVMGILWNWTDDDNAHLDQIIHTICELIEGKLPIKPL